MKVAKILTSILALVLGLIAIRWIIYPELSANSLGMIYLDGVGRNTQIRDFTAIFFSTSLFCCISLVTKQYQWVLCSGLVFLIIALMSVLAFHIHEAPLTYSSLIAELLFTSLAFYSAFIFKISKKL